MTNRVVFWEVDVQEDFMLPPGKLYVPGAEKMIPHIRRLVEAAESSGTLVVSSACAHSENDPEFTVFPAHCIKGTAGGRIIPEGLAKESRTIPSDPDFKLPLNILDSPQIVIEKQVLDVFSNPHTGELVERLGPNTDYVVFGVATEYCVECACQGLLDRGCRVSIVRDAIEALDAKQGRRTIDRLQMRGARLIDTSEAVGIVLQNRR